jgi:lambda repressor-like predicted transcriptional regulator
LPTWSPTASPHGRLTRSGAAPRRGGLGLGPPQQTTGDAARCPNNWAQREHTSPETVALRDSLSNPGKPLLRLVDALRGGSATPPDVDGVELEARDEVAQTVVENRILSPTETHELAAAYEAGASLNELARRFGVHRNTVDRHVAKAGVAKRPLVKMNPVVLAEAVDLYNRGLSVAAVGAKLGLSASTVYSTFVREKIKMRPRK